MKFLKAGGFKMENMHEYAGMTTCYHMSLSCVYIGQMPTHASTEASDVCSL